MAIVVVVPGPTRRLDVSDNSLVFVTPAVMWATAAVVNISGNYLGVVDANFPAIPPLPLPDGRQLPGVVDVSDNWFGPFSEDVLAAVAAVQQQGWVFNLSANCYLSVEGAESMRPFRIGLRVCGGQGLTCIVTPQRNCLVRQFAPNVPRAVSVVPGVAAATVRWLPPAKSTPMTSSYVVHASSINATASIRESASESVPYIQLDAALSGLTPGVAYAVTVSASNGVSNTTAVAVVVTPCHAPFTTPPEPPSAVATAPAIRSVVVSWTPAPVSVCWNGTVASYNVTAACVDGNGTTLFTTSLLVPGDSAGVVTGVRRLRGCQYRVDICGRNGAGWGAAVTVTSAAPLDVPGPPTAVAAVADNNRTVLVRWQRPVDDGGAVVLAYTVVATPVTGAGVAVVVAVNATGGGGDVNAVAVTGLVAGQPYGVNVSARNIAGTGPDAAAGNVAMLSS